MADDKSRWSSAAARTAAREETEAPDALAPDPTGLPGRAAPGALDEEPAPPAEPAAVDPDAPAEVADEEEPAAPAVPGAPVADPDDEPEEPAAAGPLPLGAWPMTTGPVVGAMVPVT
jgi:hypothetical protein